MFHTTVWGNPTFYDYAMVGGDRNARGYYYGRFRDKNSTSLQVELRSHLFWRFGMAAFGGLSSIYKNISHIQAESFKPNAGIGIRFLADHLNNTHLRIDYAVGVQQQSGFYISFGESF
jgi:outer membrane protein assembly factor BamA